MTKSFSKSGYLYVVATASGTVKFGISKNPKGRIKAHKHSMGRVSPIVYEWTSKESDGYFDVEKSMVKIYGSEYINGANPEDIRKKIEELMDAWVPSEEVSDSKSCSRLIKKTPDIKYKEVLQAQIDSMHPLHIANMCQYLDGDEPLFAHNAIYFAFGDIDLSNEDIVRQVEYVHSKLSLCEPSEIRLFLLAVLRKSEHLTMVSHVVHIDLSKIKDLVKV